MLKRIAYERKLWIALTMILAITQSVTAQKIYFFGKNGVRRANLDGTKSELVWSGYGNGLIVNKSAGWMMVTNGTSETLQLYNLEFGTLEDLTPRLFNFGGSVAFDPIGRRTYFIATTFTTEEWSLHLWSVAAYDDDAKAIVKLTEIFVVTDTAMAYKLRKLYFIGINKVADSIFRIGLEGGSKELVLDRDVKSIAIDNLRDKLYWAEGDAIYRSDLSGFGWEVFVDNVAAGALHVAEKSGLLYWGGGLSGEYRVSVDGGIPEKIMDAGVRLYADESNRACVRLDGDGDGDIDLCDYAEYQRCFGRPSKK